MVCEIRHIVGRVDEERIRRDLRYLAEDPLPCRTLNYTVPGRERCTLYEADDYVREVLANGSLEVSEEIVEVQAFVPDASFAWGFRQPLAQEPWYDAKNIYALRSGSAEGEVVVLVAHKDSQSWIERGPGACDNAVGLAALLEISRLVSSVQLERSLLLLFCNEEHWPWTSISAAQRIARSSLHPVAVLNIDSIGGKSEADVLAGRFPNVVRYSTEEGERLADLVTAVNERYSIGLEVSKAWSPPNDDDGSFVNAGIRNSVLMIGSFPYADPMYHTLSDTPDRVDIENVKRSVQLAVATVLCLCSSTNPSGL